MYLHRRGTQISKGPFLKPTWDLFCGWLRDYINENPELKYDVYLTGSFCENSFGSPESPYDPFDVDICLVGDVIDLGNLKKALYSGFELGSRHNLLIDIAWRSQIIHPQIELTSKQEKIITYLDAEDIMDTGEGRVYTMEGTVTQLSEGLYHFRDYDLSKAIGKSKERRYSVPFKKIL
jgi:hypothetical protein